ncbi:hypothetical protein TRVL_09458 [Trypanosoma vivax]|nr:hypothetical protein TRVL_09458 [Trypanosoma vivax]
MNGENEGAQSSREQQRAAIMARAFIKKQREKGTWPSLPLPPLHPSSHRPAHLLFHVVLKLTLEETRKMITITAKYKRVVRDKTSKRWEHRRRGNDGDKACAHKRVELLFKG